MMTRQEQEDVRQLLYQELARIHWQKSHYAGSYRYLCLIAGGPVFCHSPAGPIIDILR